MNPDLHEKNDDSIIADLFMVPRALWRIRMQLLPFIIIIGVKLLLHATNFTDFPYYENDEATYISRALAFRENGSLDIYTYWYDHAPAGWILLSGWFVATGNALLFGSLLNSGRLFILLLTTGSAIIVYLISKKIIKDKWFSLLAALLFIVSPLSVYYQRRVLLDNIMIFWALLGLLFLLNKPLKLRDVLIGAFTFAFAVLTKLNAIFFAPAFLWAIYKHAPAKIRTMSLALWASVAGSAMLLFPLYALLKGEFFSKNSDAANGAFTNGISLIDTLTFQSSRGTADGLLFFQSGSGFRQALHEWIDKDLFLVIFAALACATLLLFAFKKLRTSQSQLLTLGLGVVGMIFFMIRGGVVLEFYFLPILPLAAIIVASLVAIPYTKNFFTSPSARQLYRVSIIGLLIVLQLPLTMYSQTYRHNENSNLLQAVEWVRQNIPKDAYVASDNYATVPLKFNDDYINLDYNFKYEYDPAVRGKLADDWRNIDYILLTHEVLKQIKNGETPFIKQALDHSDLVAEFIDNTSSFNDIEKYISTNGDWAQIYKVKSDSDIVKQQSYEGFLTNNFVDYGQIVANKDLNYTTSIYQSNSLVRSLEQDEKDWFDGIWSWTKDHFQNRSQDRLLSSEWSVDPTTNKPSVTNANTNSLADLEIAYALYSAADKWSNDSYRAEADEILEDYWQDEVVTRQGNYYIIPQKSPNLTGSITINPSYAALPYIAYFVGNNTTYNWSKLLDDSYAMLELVQNDTTGLFPNWVDITPDGTTSPATAYAGDQAAKFGYEAFRIPLWLGSVTTDQSSSTSDTNKAVELLKPYGTYTAGLYRETEKIPATMNIDGSQQSDFDDTLMYAAAYEAIKLVDQDIAGILLEFQIIGGFDDDLGIWAINASDFNNQLWLPIFMTTVPDISLAPSTDIN